MGKVVFNTFSDYANTEKVYKAAGFAEKVIFYWERDSNSGLLNHEPIALTSKQPPPPLSICLEQGF